MTARLIDDPILRRFKAALMALYGERMERAILFGSRARGDDHPQSDYDVAVFLRGVPDLWKERQRLADLRVDFIDVAGAFFEARPFASESLHEKTPLMHEVRREGLEI